MDDHAGQAQHAEAQDLYNGLEEEPWAGWDHPGKREDSLQLEKLDSEQETSWYWTGLNVGS